jgi:hypothetical protein
MFLGLLDPDPSLYVQIRIWILPATSKKVRKTLISSFSSLFVWFSIFELKKTSVSDPYSLSPDSDPAF